MSDATILYGIGAQKSGSSWLHQYLSSHPHVHLRTQKELHYFDALDGIMRTYFKTLRNRANNMSARRAQLKFYHFTKRRLLARKVDDIESWINVFDGETVMDQEYLSYLEHGRKNAHVIGEVTPEYSIVSQERLRHMAGLAPRTKFIYILRDPLDRLWSHVRMKGQRSSNKSINFEDRAFQEMDKFLSGNAPDVDLRSDYAASLDRLKKTIPTEDLLILYFEDMFSDKSVRQITDFLAISPHPAKTEKVAFKGKLLKLDLARQQAALSKLEPQYVACASHIGAELPARWRSHREMINASQRTVHDTPPTKTNLPTGPSARDEP